MNVNVVKLLFSVILCGTCALSEHVIVKRTLFPEPLKEIPGPEKNYTGLRVRGDSDLVLYHHEQTVGIVELGESRQLLNCELLEVRTKPDRIAALVSLRSQVRTISRIPLQNMHDLMQRCQLLDRPKFVNGELLRKTARQAGSQNQRSSNRLLNFLAPNTKWCGAGDLAATYYDLGPDRELDKCCRTHDLCPVKVLGLSTQYNITNYSIYTKSHCDCDDIFYRCLKRVGTQISSVLGNIYFNGLRPDCVEDVTDKITNEVRRQFSSRKRPF